MGFKTVDRNQNNLLGYSFSDFVEDDSKEKFVVKIVEKLDTKELYNRYSSQGGEALDPKIMLATWFLGYCYGITSSRKLEYNCKRNLDFIYISANLRPDHTTLNRFRKRNLDLMESYFVEILLEALKLGVSDFKTISIDGTKMQSVSSKKKSMRTEKLEKQLRAVKEEIASYLEATESDNPPEKLIKKKENLESAKNELEKRKTEIRKDFRETHQVNIAEPDAVMLTLGGGRGNFPGYNAQVSTDTKTQLITSTDIVQDRNDEKQFIQQWANVESNLGSNPQRKYVADSGYNSHETIKSVYENGIDAFISDRHKTILIEEKIKEGKKFTKEDFMYDEKNDYYICPNQRTLFFINQIKGKSFKGKKYRSENCEDCQFKNLCLSKKNISGKRELNRDARDNYVDQMRIKSRSILGKEIMLLRQSTVETAIGNIKSNLGYSRFRLKGIESVKAEFVLMCIGHNLNKLFKLIGSFIFSRYTNLFRKLSKIYSYFDDTEIFEAKFTF